MAIFERFFLCVDRNGPVARPGLTPCWLWTGGLSKKGYGKLTVAGSTVYAHRISYGIAYGSVAEKLQILHSCDVKKCVNPKHLRAGTAKENTGEAWQRERRARLRAFTHAQIREVRGLFATWTDSAIADRYRTDIENVRNLRTGKTYYWLE